MISIHDFIGDMLSDFWRAVYRCKAIKGGLYNIENLAVTNVIFNDPATIVFWNDGTKTVVKRQNDEPYDPEKGMAMAVAKKALGNEGNYYNTFSKYLGKLDETSDN